MQNVTNGRRARQTTRKSLNAKKPGALMTCAHIALCATMKQLVPVVRLMRTAFGLGTMITNAFLIANAVVIEPVHITDGARDMMTAVMVNTKFT